MPDNIDPYGFELITSRANATLETARAIKINSIADMDHAITELESAKATQEWFEAERTAILAPIKAEMDAINEHLNPPRKFISDAIQLLRDAIAARQLHDRNEILEKRRIADEKAKIEREAAQAQAQEAREAADAIQQAAIENPTDESIKAARIAGEEAQAAALNAALSSTAVVEAAAPAHNISGRETWKAECTDLMTLIVHVATHPEHQNLLTVNKSALNALARAQKDAFKLPGCNVQMTITPVTKRKSHA